jgi:crossover junction endodeoxyribonuclease RuvC
VVLLRFAELQIPVFEYTPNEIKQAITGYGGADKAQIQLMIRAIMGLDEIPRPDDAADALAIAVCHIHSRKIRTLSQD